MGDVRNAIRLLNWKRERKKTLRDECENNFQTVGSHLNFFFDSL
jgi:hypothetical protein